ncbi:MAG TPA: hypothetical protein P5555_20160 [Candidatus Paceibacterota bacterium]|nr:hypothetical protein [Verrucomicrobiota bacterium]HRZ47498.1 hypothetical protein [Candidatus Paceibacterota bacterium]
MFETLVQVFKKRKLQDVVLGLRSQEDVFDRRIAELGYDRKRSDREAEAILKKGTDAALRRNLPGMKEAAMELKAARTETTGLDQEMGTAIKARAFVRVTRRKLERYSDSSLKGAYDKVGSLLEDPKIRDMMLRADVSLEQFMKKLDVALGRALEGAKVEEGFADEDLDTGIFIAMAEATKKGDEKTLEQLRSQVLGPSAQSKEDFENI